MEKINFNYSLKSIPTPTKTSYQLMLMEKIESRAYFRKIKHPGIVCFVKSALFEKKYFLNKN